MKPKLLLPFLFLMAANLAAQNATITGVITDSETKDYLAGTTVVIKGTTKGTITDANGKYTLCSDLSGYNCESW